MNFPFLDTESVSALLASVDTHAFLQSMADAFRAFADREHGGVIQPLRSTISIPAEDAFFKIMPAYTSTVPAMGVKLVTFFPKQPHALQSILHLFDPVTGNPMCLMAADPITTNRTAVCSVVAAQALLPVAGAQRCKDPKEVAGWTVAVFGTGTQAFSHVKFLAKTFPGEISTFRVVSRDQQRAQGFVERIQHHLQTGCEDFSHLEWVATTCGKEACDGAAVVVTATVATEPVVLGSWLSPATCILSVGACRPHWRELDDAVMERVVVVADSVEGATQEAGDIVQTNTPVSAELGRLLLGDEKGLESFKDGTKDILLFKNLGMAIADICTGILIYNKWKDS